MDSPCIKQTVCKVLNRFQDEKYLVAYVLKITDHTLMVIKIDAEKLMILKINGHKKQIPLNHL